MEVKFQLLDVDYILNNGPTLRLFGKTQDGRTVCAFFESYFPYFYFIPNKPREEVEAKLTQTFNGLIKRIDEVERFLPIGYTEKKVRLLRIFLSNPSKVPDVRDKLMNEKLAKDIFEADILFKYRFMADFNLGGMRWYRLKGEPIETKTISASLKVKAVEFEEVKEVKNVEFKILAVDIETLAREGVPNPEKDQIIMISLAFYPRFRNTNNLVLIAKPVKARLTSSVKVLRNEKEMLQEFSRIVDSFDPDILVGYNITNFDFPFILTRMRANKLSRALGRDKQKQATARKIGQNYRVSLFGRVVVDVYTLVKELANKGFIRLKRYGLGDVAKELIGDTKVDIAHSEISKFWNGSSEQVKKLIDYCRKDAELALKLLLNRKLMVKPIGLSKVSGLLLQDVLDSGEAARVENLLLREFNKRGFVIPLKPNSQEVLKRKKEREVKGLKGALVLEPKTGLYTSPVIYLDFACHPGDTEVIVKGKGKIKISDVREGDYVFGKNGWHRVRKVWCYDYDGTLIDVNGLRCTPNHRVPMLDGEHKQLRDVFAVAVAENGVNYKLIRCELFKSVSELENRVYDVVKEGLSGKFYKLEEPRVFTSHFNGKVYDLTLEGEPYYFANGVLTHNSMYPTIFINFNICPTTLALKPPGKVKTSESPYGTEFVLPSVRRGVIPKIVENLIEARKKVKAELKRTKSSERRVVLDAEQYALKVMANAFYGYTGYLRARFYVLDIANSITSYSRQFIQQTKDFVEHKLGYRVVYGDTDSIMIDTGAKDMSKAFEIGAEVARQINEFFRGEVSIKIEGVFRSLLMLAKKRYAGIALERTKAGLREKLVMKGIETIRKDWCDLTSKTLMEVLNILLRENDSKKALNYVRQTIQKIKRNEVNLEDLVITKSVSKPLHTYKGIQPHIELVKKLKKRSPGEAPSVGDRVGFVIISGPQLVSKRAEDPAYVKQHKLKVDAKYYIESQLIPPLERIFEVLGVKRGDLLNLGRQMGLMALVSDAKRSRLEESLKGFDSFVCLKCGNTSPTLPLSGKCFECGGEMVFSLNGKVSRVVELPL